MRRRDFLKRLAIAGGGLLCDPGPMAAFASQNAQATAPAAKSIRGLIEKNGRLFQPLRIPLPPEGSAAQGATAVVHVDGAALDRHTMAPGAQMLEVLTEALDTEHTANVSVEVAGNTIFSGAVTLKPVRKVIVYVLAHSHNDIGYTDIQTAIEKKQMRNIQLGIDLARKTADYPEGARFVWNMEGCWAADLWMRRRSESDQTEFIKAVQEGSIALNAMFANELTGLCRPEELLELFRYGTRLGERCSVKIDSAMISDVPGCTWGTVAAMSQAGIRYFSAAPNWFDRIGTLMQVWQDKPFWWISPSGREKVLVWVPWTGYAISHVFKKITPEWVGEYQDRLDKADFPYDISHIRWSGHGDNAEPDSAISEDIKSWNAKYVWPKFIISSTSRAFAAFEERYGKELPEFKGDLTPYWEDGAGSSALETAISRNSADRLLQAEALFAMSASGAYPAAAFSDAWRNVLLFSEHTWGAWNSVSDSENKFVKDQWQIKQSFAIAADRQSRELVDRSLAHAAERHTPATITELDICNTTSWIRSELVVLPTALSGEGNRVTEQNGKPVLSQRLSTGELAIWASGVSPFGAARYKVSPKSAHKPRTPVKIEEQVLDNGTIRARVDAKTGGISELYYRGGDNLADTSLGEQINQYLFLPGSNVADLQSNGPVKITEEENGPLVATLRIESEAPGCHKLIRKIRLVAATDYLELINIVDKKRAPLNPNPGKGGPGGEWAQRGGKESIQFAFPFNVKQGQIRVDIPLAVMRPETDQLPGACKNWLPVGRWIDVANEEGGITWTTLDAPLVEIGEISARLLGSQRKPELWRKDIEPTQKFYSWVMNNHWGTNYCAYQEGVVTFRYGLRPHKGYDPAAAARFAAGLSQPLLAAPAAGRDVRSPLLRVEPNDVLATALKPSDDGKAWIVRLFGASGEDREAKLTWSSPQPKSVWVSNLSEKPITRSGDVVAVRAWDLITLRAERT